jgi:hypothetical protein
MIKDNVQDTLARLPKRIRDTFTIRVASSSAPGYAPGVKLDALVWLIPNNPGSAIFVYECYADLTYEEDSRAWLVDAISGEWFHLGWPVNLGLLDLELTLTRVLREDIVLYEILKPTQRNQFMSTVFGRGAAIKSFQLPLFEMDRPNTQWASTEIRRYRRWGGCPTVEESGYSMEALSLGNAGFGAAAILDLFIHELKVATNAMFSWRFVDGDPDDGEIELVPNNSHSRPLRILVCAGIPCDLLTGGFHDVYGMLDNEKLADLPETIGEFPPQARSVFIYSRKWIQLGVIETIQGSGTICETSFFDEGVQFNKEHSKVKIYPGDPFWRKVVAIGAPW